MMWADTEGEPSTSGNGSGNGKLYDCKLKENIQVNIIIQENKTKQKAIFLRKGLRKERRKGGKRES